jgi:hypothetical protein
MAVLHERDMVRIWTTVPGYRLRGVLGVIVGTDDNASPRPTYRVLLSSPLPLVSPVLDLHGHCLLKVGHLFDAVADFQGEL